MPDIIDTGFFTYYGHPMETKLNSTQKIDATI